MDGDDDDDDDGFIEDFDEEADPDESVDDWREDRGDVCVNCSDNALLLVNPEDGFLLRAICVLAGSTVFLKPNLVRCQDGKLLIGGNMCWCGVMVTLNLLRGGGVPMLDWWSGEIVSITTSKVK